MRSSSFVFVAITALTSFVAATPPACLIAAVMAQPDPADLKALCSAFEPQMASNITASCSGAPLASAVADYSSTCLAQGVTVSIATAISSASSSAKTGPSGVSATGATTTGSGSGYGSNLSTGTPAASTTGKSGASTLSATSIGIWVSITLGCTLAGHYVL